MTLPVNTSLSQTIATGSVKMNKTGQVVQISICDNIIKKFRLMMHSYVDEDSQLSDGLGKGKLCYGNFTLCRLLQVV